MIPNSAPRRLRRVPRTDVIASTLPRFVGRGIPPEPVGYQFLRTRNEAKQWPPTDEAAYNGEDGVGLSLDLFESI